MTTTPKIGIIICNSGASNTGVLTGLAAYELVKERKDLGILSLPALVNRTPRQLALVKKLQLLIVVDGCKNECAKKIVEWLDINYTSYINLEYNLGIKKVGPFSTLKYKKDNVKKIKDFMDAEIVNFLSRLKKENKRKA